MTRWQSDQYASMSYSYVPVGCTADAYERMSEPVNNRIFFAGEVRYLLHSVLTCCVVVKLGLDQQSDSAVRFCIDS